MAIFTFTLKLSLSIETFTRADKFLKVSKRKTLDSNWCQTCIFNFNTRSHAEYDGSSPVPLQNPVCEARPNLKGGMSGESKRAQLDGGIPSTGW